MNRQKINRVLEALADDLDSAIVGIPTVLLLVSFWVGLAAVAWHLLNEFQIGNEVAFWIVFGGTLAIAVIGCELSIQRVRFSSVNPTLPLTVLSAAIIALATYTEATSLVLALSLPVVGLLAGCTVFQYCLRLLAKNNGGKG
nr:hypothetical protein [Brucella intermedia]